MTENTSDILVIGGGIAGISAAARLSGDAKVTVIEGEKALGYHASGRSAALIEENYGAPSVQALNKATVGYLRDGGYLSPRGLMIIADRHEEEAFHSDLAHMGVEQITPDDALRLVPILAAERIAFAGYHADAHDIDTDRLLQDFAKELRGNGGRIETGHPVTSITRTGNTWKVTAGPHIHHAAKLLNAAGAWDDQIAILAGVPPIGITPYRRSMARIAAPGGHDLSRWPMFFGVGETWYAKPDAGALLISPADEDATEPQDAWADDMVLAEGLERYQNMVAVPLTKPIATWAGLRSFAVDRTLVLGPDPAQPDFIWSAGQGGYGFQTSAAASQLVADLTLGNAPSLPDPVVEALRPDRLRA
ncbi:FAD-dependent oxidoreductase [uncultured Sulfitobacter sp.]|uniref:NAD(P)/FAD-dependent oxidoreductase n=1 Tax=uncultured Sulfitobacter sp. TaxID=191468 RepID=UPI00259282AB|nr:FAD-dependent oxidoreductase [uncultured Sulfitobacter sp.]